MKRFIAATLTVASLTAACASDRPATEVAQREYSHPKASVQAIRKVVEVEEEVVQQDLSEPLFYTEEDVELLAMAIYQEAGGDACSDETRIMVGNVILNRVADPRFPDNIHEVLTDKAQYGRFHWTGVVWADRASDEAEKHAVNRARECARRVLEGEKLLPDNVIWQAEFKQGDEVYAYQDGIYFCY